MSCSGRARSATQCWWWRASAALAALVTAPPGLGAQAPAPVRAALAAYADTLSRFDAYPARGEPAADAEPALGALRRGFAELRLGAVSPDRAPLDRSLAAFDAAARSRPDWAWPWFARALAKLALFEGGYVSKPDVGGQLAGESYYDGFIRDVTAAFERDSLFRPAVDFLIPFLSQQGDRTQPEPFRSALSRVERLQGLDPAIHLVLGRVERADGRDDLALAEFRTYRATGGDSGVADLEIARSLAALARPDPAAAAYLAGLTDPSPAARERYRRDFQWIAEPAELGAFDALPADSLQPWARQFWSVRDALAAREPGERLREHLRRWAYAYRHFRIPRPRFFAQFIRARVASPGIACTRSKPDGLDSVLARGNPSDETDLFQGQAVVDQRAIVYLRHGEPWSVRGLAAPLADTAIPTPPGAGAPPEAPVVAAPDRPSPEELAAGSVWVYWFEGRPRVFFFGTTVPGSAMGGRAIYVMPPLFSPVYQLLAPLDPLYGRAAARMRVYENTAWTHAVPLTCLPTIQDVMVQAEQDVETGVRTDSYTLAFPTNLGSLAQVYAVRNAGGSGGRLLLTTAVPDTALRPPAFAGVTGRMGLERLVRLWLRFTAVDRAAGTVRRVDSTRTFALPEHEPAGSYLAFVTELPAPPGRYAVHAAVFDSTRNAGDGFERRGIEVPGPGLALSDVIPLVAPVPGLAGETGVPWVRNGARLRINALGGYRRNEPAPIYYEVYGLAPGRSYRTRIAVYRRDRKPESGVQLVFTETAAGEMATEERTLDLRRLSPGQYRLEVTVEDGTSGLRVSRARLIEIAR